MHPYVRHVLSQIDTAASAGRGGYLRVKADADTERVRVFLREERDAAQTEIDSSPLPGQLLNYSVAMQMLILTELLLKDLAVPVDIRALSMAQGHGSGYVSERIEEAVQGLLMMSRQLEVVHSL